MNTDIAGYIKHSQEIIVLWTQRKDQYELIDERNGTEILKRESSVCDFPAYTIVGTMPGANINDVADMLFELNEEEAMKRIPFLSSYKTKNLDENIKIISQINDVGFFIAKRHTCVCHVKLRDENKIYLVGFSVESDIETPKNHVRTTLHRSVIELVQSENVVNIRLTTLFDPKMSSPPSFLVDMVVCKAVDSFNKWTKESQCV